MSTFVNFPSQSQPTSIATTLAVGEEGGDRPTTLALGEEGGDTFPPFDRTSRRTEDYLDVLNQADIGPFGQFGDGRVTRDELGRLVNGYQQQIGFLRQWADIYSRFYPYAVPFFERLIEQIDSKARVGQRMLDNFTTFAQGSPTGPRPFDDPNSINQVDIFRLSERDGNSRDISDFDIGRRRFFPPFPIPFFGQSEQGPVAV